MTRPSTDFYSLAAKASACQDKALLCYTADTQLERGAKLLQPYAKVAISQRPEQRYTLPTAHSIHDQIKDIQGPLRDLSGTRTFRRPIG